MAKNIVRSGRRELAAKKNAIEKTGGTSAPKKHAKKAAKHAKKHAKKAPKHEQKRSHGVFTPDMDDAGLITAFHHMQRASVVMSLMEEDTGEDLRDLLERGVNLYLRFVEGAGGEKMLLQAIGLLRAAEHLSMAGLYAAREQHGQQVAPPGSKWLMDFLSQTEHRLEKVEGEERGKGTDLFPVTVELLRQAEDADHDAHLAFELVMAADALCFALENGL